VGLVPLEVGKYVVFLIQVSELDIKYCAGGTLYNYALLEIPKLS
jgi:hypothetical protein